MPKKHLIIITATIIILSTGWTFFYLRNFSSAQKQDQPTSVNYQTANTNTNSVNNTNSANIDSITNRSFDYQSSKFTECKDHYTVYCYRNTELIEENIPCQTDDDCTATKMREYCDPDRAKVFGCSCRNGEYYCEQSYCRGADCSE